MRRLWRVAVCALACGSIVACGKKGPPRPPFSRIPAPVTAIAAKRIGDDVFVSFRVPSQNTDGSTPAEIATVDVFALTTEQPPSRQAFQQRGRKIATLPVKMPPAVAEAGTPPPLSAAASSAAPPARAPQTPATSTASSTVATPGAPASPNSAGERPPDTVAPGQDVTVRETLTADALTPVTLPPERGRGRASAPARPAAPAASSSTTPAAGSTPPAPPTPRRYYLALASSSRKRSSPTAAEASVSTTPPPEALPQPTLTYDEHTLTLSWTAVDDADSYNVYRETAEAQASASDSSSALAAIPGAINATPLTATTMKVPVEFGARVCFRVSRVHKAETGEPVESRPSQPGCETPVDMFPPGPPQDIVATAGAGEITVRWTESREPDLAGYVVLRGAPGDATLAPITETITSTRFTDRNVMSGVRYVYAVVAVDKASPRPNRSAPSARDEATAR